MLRGKGKEYVHKNNDKNHIHIKVFLGKYPHGFNQLPPRINLHSLKLTLLTPQLTLLAHYGVNINSVGEGRRKGD